MSGWGQFRGSTLVDGGLGGSIPSVSEETDLMLQSVIRLREMCPKKFNLNCTPFFLTGKRLCSSRTIEEEWFGKADNK